MPLRIFREAPRVMAPRELLQLRERLGGRIGQLQMGAEHGDAVQVRENVFVVAGRSSLSAAAKAMVNVFGADIHEMKSPADVELLAQRLEEYDRGSTEKP